MKYEVIVGNIGTVYNGDSRTVAREIFETYVSKSRIGLGRCSGEPVTLMQDGEPTYEYQGGGRC